MMYHMFHKITTNSFKVLAEAMKIHDGMGPSLEVLNENLTLHEQLESVRPEGAPQVNVFSIYFFLGIMLYHF